MRIEADALAILDDERRLPQEALALKMQPVVRGKLFGKMYQGHGRMLVIP